MNQLHQNFSVISNGYDADARNKTYENLMEYLNTNLKFSLEVLTNGVKPVFTENLSLNIGLKQPY